MQKTVAALYPTLRQASVVLDMLKNEGFSSDRVALITHNAEDTYQSITAQDDVLESDNTDAAEAAVGAGIGAATGGVTGLLAVAATLAIPGVGPLLAAGPIAAMLTGAGVGAGLGAGVGAFAGVLADYGVDKEEADVLAEGVRKGGSLVIVQCSHHEVSEVTEILSLQDPVDMERVKTMPSAATHKRPSTSVRDNPYINNAPVS